MNGSGLTPVELESGQIAFSEAKLVIECKVIYSDILEEFGISYRIIHHR